jgi:hypothetical protein
VNWDIDRIGSRAQIPLTLGGYFGWAYVLWPKSVALIGRPQDVNWMAVLAVSIVVVGLFSTAAQAGWLHRKQAIDSPPPPLSHPVESASQATAQTHTVPVVSLTLRTIWLNPYDSTSGRWYPRKLNLQFSNDADAEIRLGAGCWIKDEIGLQTGRPQRPAVYTYKTHLGTWSDESTDGVVVHSSQWVRIWIGLDSSLSDSEVTKLLTEGKAGILEMPAEVSGQKIKIRVRPQLIS